MTGKCLCNNKQMNGFVFFFFFEKKNDKALTVKQKSKTETADSRAQKACGEGTEQARRHRQSGATLGHPGSDHGDKDLHISNLWADHTNRLVLHKNPSA